MSMLGFSRSMMDDLLFHELWLAKNKFKDYENEDKAKESSDEDEDDGDAQNMKELFKDEKRKIGNKTKAVASTTRTEWIAIVLGVFFVAALAGMASYQAYRSDFSLQLSRMSIRTHFQTKSDSFSEGNNTFFGEALYNEVFLPNNFKPIAYVLYLDVNMDARLCTGLVKITVMCKESTNRIILHSGKMKIRKVQVRDKDKKLNPRSILFNRHREMMVVNMKQNLTSGTNYSIFVSFEKILKFQSNDGFYLSKYIDGKGKEHIMASTYFEPYFARRAFPCFDEPKYKATYVIVISHEKQNYAATSNMPINKKINIESNRIENHFQKTPPMSSYLVGWTISGLAYKETKIRKDLPLRVYAPTGRLAETTTALQVAPMCILFYEEHFQINYTLPKIDLIPVASFMSAADEIWGQIIFLANYLLFNSNSDSLTKKETITSTICHELAHQWFGDLVTMSQWRDLWLKESFASFLQSLPLRKAYPEWKIPENIYMKDNLVALAYDSSIYTHSIQINETDPAKLRVKYDAITYQKGAAVLRMLENFLGEKDFFAGVHNYLEKYKFMNADATQFWESITEVLHGVNVLEFMDAWVKKPGYPVVLIQPMAANNSKLSIRQDRFVFQNTSKKLENFEITTWHIPIKIKFSNNSTVSTLLTKREDTIIMNTSNISWYKANYGATGYYRVYYSRKNWLALLKILNEDHKTFPAIDRTSILSDVSSFANYKYMTLDASMEFTLYLKDEREYVPWVVGLRQILNLRNLFYNTPLKECFDRYINKQISPSLDELNSKASHSHDQIKLISMLLNVAVEIEKKPLVDELHKMFLLWLIRDKNFKIPATARYAVFKAGIRMSQMYEWNSLLTKLKTATISDKVFYLKSLAQSKDPDLLKRLIELALNKSMISHDLIPRTFQYVCGNPVGKKIAWSALKNNYKFLAKSFKDQKRLFWFSISACLGSGKTERDLNEAINFMKKEKLVNYVRMKRIVEYIRYRIELSKEYTRVKDWFEKHDKGCFS